MIDENREHLMSEELVAEAIMVLLIAGHDGVTSTITLIVKYLAELRLPHIYDAVDRVHLFFLGGFGGGVGAFMAGDEGFLITEND